MALIEIKNAVPSFLLQLLTCLYVLNLTMTSFTKINLSELSTTDRHQSMISLVSPRPIALVSTLGENGVPNVAPFSYFMALSSTPPMVAFSCNIKPDGSEKDTLRNVKFLPECVINMVSQSIVDNISIASMDFERSISEFGKAGLTPLPSDSVQPARVAQSPAQMECRVKEVLQWTDGPGASSLVICDVLSIHVREEDYVKAHRLSPEALDLVGRMGKAYYSKTSAEAIFSNYIPQNAGILGYDGLPDFVKQSPLLSAQDIYAFAKMECLPTQIGASWQAQTEVASCLSMIRICLEKQDYTSALEGLFALEALSSAK